MFLLTLAMFLTLTLAMFLQHHVDHVAVPVVLGWHHIIKSSLVYLDAYVRFNIMSYDSGVLSFYGQ